MGSWDRLDAGVLCSCSDTQKRTAIGSVFDSGIHIGEMVLKKRGRFVVEAALLVPGICLLLVYIVFFTLYAHDYAVCAHTALESGIKGVYRDGVGDSQKAQNIKADLEQKLSQRLLWMREKEVEIQVNPIRVAIRISGGGYYFPEERIEVERTIYRTAPCETIRRSRWLKE